MSEGVRRRRRMRTSLPKSCLVKGLKLAFFMRLMNLVKNRSSFSLFFLSSSSFTSLELEDEDEEEEDGLFLGMGSKNW
jgi:hypothetical protein